LRACFLRGRRTCCKITWPVFPSLRSWRSSPGEDAPRLNNNNGPPPVCCLHSHQVGFWRFADPFSKLFVSCPDFNFLLQSQWAVYWAKTYSMFLAIFMLLDNRLVFSRVQEKFEQTRFKRFFLFSHSTFLPRQK
jgi:hypothetical protein